jgi:hypothetical protein
MPPAIIYRTAGSWGAGEGANLQPAELDQNFHELAQAVENIEQLSPIEIAAINVVDNQMTIVLEDYTVFGPFTLPVPSLTVTGPWEPETAYERYELFTADDGLYMVVQPHTSSVEPFNPNDGNEQGPFVRLLVPYQTMFDIGFFYPAQPGYGIGDEYTEDIEQPMFSLLASRAFYLPEDLPLSIAKLTSGPSVAMTMRILKNGTDIGTLQFGVGETTGTFTFAADVSFAAGDILDVYRPIEIDDTAYNLRVTLVAHLGTP